MLFPEKGLVFDYRLEDGGLTKTGKEEEEDEEKRSKQQKVHHTAHIHTPVAHSNNTPTSYSIYPHLCMCMYNLPSLHAHFNVFVHFSILSISLPPPTLSPVLFPPISLPPSHPSLPPFHPSPFLPHPLPPSSHLPSSFHPPFPHPTHFPPFSHLTPL